ncbi:hypothetical protein FJY94_06330 [Candidatus Kaiserbacteria bacterium]|nr:hypothetical protein [Candidatus Kaiserbacteria bacterium]
MAKNHTWNGSTLTQTLCGEQFTVDITALPKEIVDKALQFALPTLLRNATAGLATEDPGKAKERVAARIAAWLDGQWTSKGEASATPRGSLLVQALAEVKGITTTEAASIIEASIEKALAAQGIDPEGDEEEQKKAKDLAKELKDMFALTPEIEPVYKRIQAERAAAKADAAAKAAAAKPKVSLASLIG